MVCFWYDLRAVWKITWKLKEAASVVGVWDMIGKCDRGRTYEVLRRVMGE